jgi:AhpD family alkylhydroperoxidase
MSAGKQSTSRELYSGKSRDVELSWVELIAHTVEELGECLSRLLGWGKQMIEKPVNQHQKMKARHPQLLDAVDALGMAVAKAGPLNDKVRQLVQLAASAAIRSEGAVHSHTRRAVEAGASAEEVRHAILLLTSTIGFPTVMAAMTWADDVLEAS